MSKVAYVLTTYPSLSETFIEREIGKLIYQGFDVSILAASEDKRCDTNNSRTYYRPPGLSFQCLWLLILNITTRPIWIFKLILLIFIFLRESIADAKIIAGNIHTILYFGGIIKVNNIEHIHCGFLSWPACIGLAVSKITNTDFSISAHARDIFVESGAVTLKAANCKFICCCNKYGLKSLEKKIPKVYHKKLFLTYHGIDIKNNPSINSEKSNHILVAGRLVKKKGIDVLLRAMEDIVQGNRDIHLIIAGDGTEKSNLQKLCKDLGLQENVHFIGWVKQNELRKLINDSYILVAPSIVDKDQDRDGIPNIILEAFATKTAVIATNVGGISEAVLNNKTGLLIEPDDKYQLASSINYLLGNTDLNLKLCTNAFEFVKENFNLTQNIQELARMFKVAINE